MQFISQFPLVRIVVPFIIGILLSNEIYFLDYFVSVAGILFFLIIFFDKARKYFFTSYLIHVLLIFIGGIWHSQFSSQKNLDQLDIDQQISWIGSVKSISEKEEGYTSFIIKIDKIKVDSVWLGQDFKVDFKSEGNRLNISEGSILSAKSIFKQFTAPLNPEQFDYADYMANQGINYFSFENDYSIVGEEFSLIKYATTLRKKAIHAFRQMGISGDELAVLVALSLGDKTQLDHELKTSYSSAGAMHILAVSGLHVGIIFLILSKILSFLPNSKGLQWLRAIILITIMWGYAILTGLSPSVQRASLMFSFIILSKVINRNSNIINSIAGSAFILLLMDTRLLFDVGFQLSYSAVLGIVVLYPTIYSWFHSKYYLIDKLWSISVVSIAATISTLPFTLYYFHQFPNWFIITNLFVIPIAFIIVGGGILLLVVWSMFGHDLFLSKLMSIVLRILNGGVELLNHFPYSVTKNIWYSPLLIFFIALSIVFLMIYIYSAQKRFFFLSLFTIFIVVLTDLITVYRQTDKKFIGVYALKSSPVVFVEGLKAEVITENGLGFFDRKLIENHLNSLKIIDVYWNDDKRLFNIKIPHVRDKLLVKLDFKILELYEQKYFETYSKSFDPLLIINHSSNLFSTQSKRQLLSYDFPIWKIPNDSLNQLAIHSLKEHGYYQIDL